MSRSVITVSTTQRSVSAWRELGERENLERQLGLTVSLLSDLQSGIVVLGPLLAASIALLLPSA